MQEKASAAKVKAEAKAAKAEAKAAKAEMALQHRTHQRQAEMAHRPSKRRRVARWFSILWG